MTPLPDPPATYGEDHAEADDAIPTLMEIVHIADDEPAAPPASGAAPEPDWSGLEQRVCAQVLERLERHAENLVDDAVREALATALERAAALVASETRAALSQYLHDLVARAVAEEIVRVRAEAGASATHAGADPDATT